MDIKAVVEKSLNEMESSGKLERIVQDNLEKMVQESLKEATSRYSSKALELFNKKLEDVLVSKIEGMDFNEYVYNLDLILKDLLKELSSDSNKTVENFRSLTKSMNNSSYSNKKDMTLEDFLDKLSEMISSRIEWSDIHEDYFDMYEERSLHFIAEIEEKDRSYSSIFKYSTMYIFHEDRNYTKDEELKKYFITLDMSNYSDDEIVKIDGVSYEKWSVKEPFIPRTLQLKDLDPINLMTLELISSVRDLLIPVDLNELTFEVSTDRDFGCEC